MDPDPGYQIWVWENTLFWPQSGALLGRVDPLIFSAKVVSYCGGQICLFLVPKWRPAVEGRSEFGKLICWIRESSNILQDSWSQPNRAPPNRTHDNLFYNVETEVVNRRVLTLEKVGLKNRGSLLRNCFTTLCFVHLR